MLWLSSAGRGRSSKWVWPSWPVYIRTIIRVLLPTERSSCTQRRTARHRRRRDLLAPRCRVLSVQEASQRLAIVVLGLLGHAGIRYWIEAVIRPRIHVKLDRHPGAAQSVRIDHVFFEEEIKTANRNVGWRQARHIHCSRCRRIRRDVGRARLFAEQGTPSEIIVLLRPDKLADVRMQVLAHRRAVVNHRIDQMLKREFWSRPVARVE